MCLSRKTRRAKDRLYRSSVRTGSRLEATRGRPRGGRAEQRGTERDPQARRPHRGGQPRGRRAHEKRGGGGGAAKAKP